MSRIYSPETTIDQIYGQVTLVKKAAESPGEETEKFSN